MRKIKQSVILLLLALFALFAFDSIQPAKIVVAEAAQKDVVTLNAKEFKNWPVGKEGKFTVRVNGTIVDRTTMTWKSSNEKVATCEKGHLKAVGGGTAVITCTKENGTVAECTVTVKDVVTLNTDEIKGWTVGKEADFAAYVNGKRVSNSTMTWKSNNTSIVTCVGGRLKAVGAGTTTITCTKTNGTVAKCTVTVKGQDVVTLNTDKINGWTVGKEGDFAAYVNGKRVNNSTMTWKSSNTAVATCVGGHLKATGAGTAVITCTKTNGTVAQCTVTVKGKDIVTLNTSEIKNWMPGKSASFVAYVNGKRVNNSTMTWKSSNTAVATCVDGLLTAVGGGTTTITCTKANGTTASCTVTVKDIVTLNTSEIKNWTPGKSASFVAYVNGKRVNNSTMTWKSSNTAVATCVDGLLTAVGGGTVTITCTKANGTTASCTVTVKDIVTLNTSEIKNWTPGKSASFVAYVNGKRVNNSTMTWKSSNTAVVTCVDGLLTAVGGGTAAITCTKDNGTVAKCTVTVKEIPTPTPIIRGDYRIDGTTLTLSGRGVLNSWRDDGMTHREICKEYKITKIVVSDGFTSIGDFAFIACSNVKQILLPEGITSIGNRAFDGCNELQEIDIPERITSIGDRAFEGCKELRKVVIPKRVSKIGNRAFFGCNALREVVFPESITQIQESVFEGCGKLNHVTIPEKVKTIGTRAFYGCSSLFDIIIPETVTNIDETAFHESGLEIMEVIENDTSRWGMWDLTYKEFIEMYKSIGTENDLFIKMLKEKGPRHTDPTLYYEFDGMTNLDITFPDVLTEKIYALHYAPFEYNSRDLETGEYGKTQLEAFIDHGGVCGILTDTYHTFIREILGETSWKYCPYGNPEVNHAALLVQTEDGRVFQIDNCGVDYWWLGLEFKPNESELKNLEESYSIVQEFQRKTIEIETTEKLYWHTFTFSQRYDASNDVWKGRPIWYNYVTKELETYFCGEIPRSYTVTYRGLPGKVVSMAGHTKMEGYVSLSELEFE